MHALEEHTLSLPTWNQRANDSREAGRGDLPGALQSPKSQLRLDEPPGERLWVKEGLRQGGQAGRDGCKEGALTVVRLSDEHRLRAAGLRGRLGASLRCAVGLALTCEARESVSATGRAIHSPYPERSCTNLSR